MKKIITFIIMLTVCLLAVSDVCAEEDIKLSVTAGTGEAYGKQATELGNISVTDGKVTGTLNYVTDYIGFSNDTSEQKGYFLFLKLGERTSDATYKFQIKGEGTKSKEAVELKQGDDLIVAKLNNNKQTIEVTATKGETTKTLTYRVDELKLDKLSMTITIPESSTETTLGEKIASDLQSGVSFETKTGFSGTLHYLENFDEFAEGAKGYFLFFQVNGGENSTVAAALTGEGAEHPDVYVTSEDGLFIFKVNKNTESIKVRVTGGSGEYYEDTYSLSNLVLEGTEPVKSDTPAKKDEKNPSTGDRLLTYVSLGVVVLIGVFGIGLYFKRVNE